MSGAIVREPSRATLYLKGHSGALVFVIHLLCLLGAIALGTTTIHVPWASSNSAGVIPFNFVFAIALVSSSVVFWENRISVMEENSSQSWVWVDWSFFVICLVECGVVAAIGNRGMLQYALICFGLLFTACTVTTLRKSFYAVLLVTAVQCVLISVLPSRYLPVFWPDSGIVIALAAILSTGLFAIVRSSMKRGNSFLGWS